MIAAADTRRPTGDPADPAVLADLLSARLAGSSAPGWRSTLKLGRPAAEAVRWWQVAGATRWAVGCRGMAERHLSGDVPSATSAYPSSSWSSGPNPPTDRLRVANPKYRSHPGE
ncbi:hypothetical protein ACL02T_30840 [Pseudonocardia sp. RS010]|uniref:hypothetical protein n=1 Tax=Pseudonocardia sp. RS010 TaxID=3385979 RepID=UPI0039A03C51